MENVAPAINMNMKNSEPARPGQELPVLISERPESLNSLVPNDKVGVREAATSALSDSGHLT